jgi:hypothetical protein
LKDVGNKAIREAVGNKTTFEVMPIKVGSVQKQSTTLNALAAFDIQHCEEPIPSLGIYAIRIGEESPFQCGR